MRNNNQLIAISGKLGKGSYNKMVLKTTKELAYDNIITQDLLIDDIPTFNTDIYESSYRKCVKNLRVFIKSDDGIISDLQEYSCSVTCGIKNTNDFFNNHFLKPLNKKSSWRFD